MTDRIPAVCDLVLYTLSEQDAVQINTLRKDARNKNAAGVTLASQELGAQIHTGNHVQAGDVYPMVIVKTWGNTPTSAVNGQVLLDGNDTFWATSVAAGDGERHFTWPKQAGAEGADSSAADDVSESEAPSDS
jgi:hypothetical protein